MAELQAQVNDLRAFYSKKVRTLEDKAREAEARATAAEHQLRESREKWASTKARMTARLTFLERKSLQQEGKPGEMDRLRGELQEARAHADWYQQQMAFFEQQNQDVKRAMVGQTASSGSAAMMGATPSGGPRPSVARYPVGGGSGAPGQLAGLARQTAADEQLAAMRHSTEMERMRSEHALEMERLRSEMQTIRQASNVAGTMNGRSNNVVSRLDSHLELLEQRYNQRELSLQQLGASSTMGIAPGQQQQQYAAAMAAKNAEVMAMQRELSQLVSEIEMYR